MKGKKVLLVIFLTLFLFFSGCVVKAEERNIQIRPTFNDSILPTVNLTFKEIEYPIPIYTNKPIYKPILRVYEIDKSDDIWHAKDPSSYITPNNEWVQYYAKNDLSVGIIYRTDDDMYNYPANGDIWQNADYTLYTGYGDCEDIAIVEMSILRAKGKDAVVVGGYITLDNGNRIRDFWSEVYSDGIKSSISSNPVIISQKELRLEPLYMFNDKITWRSYNAKWYNN